VPTCRLYYKALMCSWVDCLITKKRKKHVSFLSILGG
jgi:hypothetical protein